MNYQLKGDPIINMYYNYNFWINFNGCVKSYAFYITFNTSKLIQKCNYGTKVLKVSTALCELWIYFKKDILYFRSQYEQLIEEGKNKCFDERRVSFLKAQALQLERQVILHTFVKHLHLILDKIFESCQCLGI